MTVNQYKNNFPPKSHPTIKTKILAFNFSVPIRRVILADLSIVLCIFLQVIFFREYADVILLISWILIICYLFITKRYFAILHLLIATILATTWVSFARDLYGYKFDYLTVYGVNTFPLMAWTLTLLGLGELCNNLELRRKILYFFLFTSLFWICLIIVETVAFHVFNFKNTMTSKYEGIPYFDCIHAPTWMKVWYFCMGPVYYGLINSADHFIIKWNSNQRKGGGDKREANTLWR